MWDIRGRGSLPFTLHPGTMAHNTNGVVGPMRVGLKLMIEYSSVKATTTPLIYYGSSRTIYGLIDVFINTADLKRKFIGSLTAYNAMRDTESACTK